MCACILSLFSHVRLFVVLWTIAHQVLLSMGFSRKEYWSGLPCPSPGDLPNPGTEPTSLMFPALAGRFFTTCATWEDCRVSELGINICILATLLVWLHCNGFFFHEDHLRPILIPYSLEIYLLCSLLLVTFLYIYPVGTYKE